MTPYLSFVERRCIRFSVQDCSRIKDAKILADGEGWCAVKGFAVYMFDNELYTVQGFCSCNEFILFSSNNPINCDSLELCDFENVVDIQKCILDLKFYENAEYLFNVSFE
jgi:hypothetical protein